MSEETSVTTTATGPSVAPPPNFFAPSTEVSSGNVPDTLGGMDLFTGGGDGDPLVEDSPIADVDVDTSVPDATPEDLDDGTTEVEEDGSEEDGATPLLPDPTEKSTILIIDEKEQPITLEAIIPTPVDGEIERPTLQDLRNAYASRAGIRKELEKLKEEKVEVAKTRRQASQAIEEKELALQERAETVGRAADYLEQDNFEGALNELFGYDPDKWDRFDAVMVNYYPKFSQLNDTEKRALQLDRRARLKDVQQERIAQRGAIRQGLAQFRQFKSNLAEQAGLSEEEIDDGWASLDTKARKGELSQANIDQLKNASPEQKLKAAAAEALSNKSRAKIASTIKKNFPKMENRIKELTKDIEATLGATYLMKATEKDIADLIRQVYMDGESVKKVAPTDRLGDKAQPRHKAREAATLKDDDDDIYAQEHKKSASNVWGLPFRGLV